MGKAYGTPVPTTLDGPQILAAERQATDKLDRTYHGCPPDVLWRVEAVSYSQCVDPDADRYASSPPRLELFALPVHKWTGVIYLTPEIASGSYLLIGRQ